jgi:hypothetical protein
MTLRRPYPTLFLLLTLLVWGGCNNNSTRSETDGALGETGTETPGSETMAPPTDLKLKSNMPVADGHCVGLVSLKWSSKDENAKVQVFMSSSQDEHKTKEKIEVTENPWTMENFSMNLNEERKFYIQLVSADNEKQTSDMIEFPEKVTCLNAEKSASTVDIVIQDDQDATMAALLVDQSMLDADGSVALGYLVTETAINMDDENLDWTALGVQTLDPTQFEAHPDKKTHRWRKNLLSRADQGKFVYILKMGPDKNIECIHHQQISFESPKPEHEIGYLFNYDDLTVDLLLSPSLALPPSGIHTATIGYVISETKLKNIEAGSEFIADSEGETEDQQWLRSHEIRLASSAGGSTADPSSRTAENCILLEEKDFEKNEDGLFHFFDVATAEHQDQHLYVVETFGKRFRVLSHKVIDYTQKTQPSPTADKKQEEIKVCNVGAPCEVSAN